MVILRLLNTWWSLNLTVLISKIRPNTQSNMTKLLYLTTRTDMISRTDFIYKRFILYVIEPYYPMIGNKDIDRKLFNELEDEDLVNMCQVNKKAQSLCNDQIFWMNRVFQRFGYVGGNILRTNKDKYWGTWSEYYIKDLRKIKSNATFKLIFGSYKGRLDHVVISLMGHGADIHIGNDEALKSASQYGHLDIVRYLVGLKPDGANIHIDNDIALRLASENGHLDIVRYLVELKPDGGDIHTRDEYALRWASINGHSDIVKYLISAGANVYANDDEALRYSSQNGHSDVVKYLISAGSNVYANDDEALRYSSQNGHLDIVKYLISAGANIHTRNNEALRWASDNGHIEVVKYLVGHGANYLIPKLIH